MNQNIISYKDDDTFFKFKTQFKYQNT